MVRVSSLAVMVVRRVMRVVQLLRVVDMLDSPAISSMAVVSS